MHCTKCGASLKQGSLYCSKCGSKVYDRTASKEAKATIASFGILIFAILVFLVWRFSPYWPWPTEDEKDKRLQQTVDICTVDTHSNKCQKLRSLYGIEFEFCKKYSSKYGDSILNATYEGEFGVAWFEGEKRPDERNSNEYHLYNYWYRDCSSNPSSY